MPQRGTVIAPRAGPMRAHFLVLSVLSAFAFTARADSLGSCSEDRGPLAAFGEALTEAGASEIPVPGVALNFRVEDGRWITKVETGNGGQGVLFAGAPLELISAPSRFPRCGNSNVTAYVRTDDGRLFTVPMGGYDYMLNRFGNVQLPADAKSVDVWFKSESQSSDRWGGNVQTCTEWDSNFGKNYHFDLKPFDPSVAHFPADASAAPSLDEPLKKGGAIALDYDPARLTGCRTSNMGYPTWGIRAHARFDDGSEATADVVMPGDREARRASIGIPDGASHADVWFENYGLYPGDPASACKAYDSNLGANYSFDVR